MQLHKLNLHTASTPGFEPGGGRRELSLLPHPCSIIVRFINSELFRGKVFSSEFNYSQYIFLVIYLYMYYIRVTTARLD